MGSTETGFIGGCYQASSDGFCECAEFCDQGVNHSPLGNGFAGELTVTERTVTLSARRTAAQRAPMHSAAALTLHGWRSAR